MSGKASRRRPAGSTSGARPARDSSAPESKPAAAKPRPASQGIPGKRGQTTVADDDDPFGVGATRVAGDVVQASPKPTRGRIHKVTCPMCDTAGFIPKSAAGRQVRCANEKCLVPIFTPHEGGQDADERRRSQASETGGLTGGTAISPGPGSPIRIYLIAAGVLLPLAGLFVWYVSRPKTDESSFARPVDIDWSKVNAEDEDETGAQGAAESQPGSQATATPRQEADRIIRRMISTARLEGNRDKVFARRLTADAWFRLDKPDLAAQELSHLTTVARQTTAGRSWLQIEPRLTEYWRAVEHQDSSAAASAIEKIRKDAASVTSGGRLAYETVIGIAAAMANAGDPPGAATLIDAVDQDRSIIANRDVMCSAAWFQSAARLRAAGLKPFAAGDVFAWSDAIRTAVAADLCSHSAWAAATTWCTAQTDPQCVSDSLAVVAELACRRKAGGDILAAVTSAAAAAGPAVALRVNAVIAGETISTDGLGKCRQQLEAIAIPDPMPLPPSAQLARSVRLPADRAALLNAAAAAEVARAAALCGDAETAADAIQRTFRLLAAVAPPTPDVRRAILELEQHESRVEQRIAKELRLSTQPDIASRFRQYRRSLDQLGNASELRRLYLLQRLARIVRAGGVEALEIVLSNDSNGVRQEVVMDEMARLLAASAARLSKRIDAVESPERNLIVARPTRMEALPEAALSTTLAQAWAAVNAGDLKAAVAALDAGRNLPGFREALLNEIIEQAAERVKAPEEVYAAIAGMSNPVWREEALQVASRILAQRGMATAAEKWLDGKKIPPTELLTAYYGLVLGLLEQPAAP